MDTDRISGSAKETAGKVESALGNGLDNAQTQAAGKAREAAGTVQKLYGQAKDAARDAGIDNLQTYATPAPSPGASGNSDNP